MTGRGSGLLADLDVIAEADAPIGPLTWYGVGGRADLLVHPQSVEALAALVVRCRRSRTPLRLLGAGANVLVADDGVDGVVVRLDAEVFRETRYNRDGPATRLRAMAGADLPKTLMDTVRRGLRGLHVLGGIPASIGGAIRMNAGGRFGSIGDAVERVTCISRGGEIVTYPAEELEFGYRRTNLTDPVILAATFNLTPDDPVALRDEVKEIFAYKKASQPLADHSAGCAFRNPVDPVSGERVSAGQLIDTAHLKGTEIGGASVSPRHANFVVCQGGAAAGDVLTLLHRIRDTVFARRGIELEPEVAIWRRGGRGLDPLERDDAESAPVIGLAATDDVNDDADQTTARGMLDLRAPDGPDA